MLVNHCLGVLGRIEPPPYGLREKVMSNQQNRNKSIKTAFHICTITPQNLLFIIGCC